MTNRELFPIKLKYYMDKARVNQTDLATAVNVSKSTVHCWLTGKAFPRIDVIQRIADTLGCKTDDLLVKREMSFGLPSRPFHPDVVSILQNRTQGRQLMAFDSLPEPTGLDEDDEELIRLWSDATPAAKQAALAVLKAMESVKKEP